MSLTAIITFMNGENAKQGYPDWRMFDKGYYQAIRKIKSDWEGFIKILKDNNDDESMTVAEAAKKAQSAYMAKKRAQYAKSMCKLYKPKKRRK